MYVKIKGFGINYNIDGPATGIPVVFIHGFPFSQEMWKSQVDILRAEYYVVTYDVRGHGQSDIGSAQYAIEYFVDDLIGLLDHLRISQCVLVGLSMGGYIALRATEREPDRVRGLVLCNTKSEADTNEQKLKRANQAKNVKIFGIKKFAESFIKTIFAEKTFQQNQDAVKLIRKLIEQTSTSTIAGTLIALAARTDTTPSLSRINVPTLIMAGQFDEVAPPSLSFSMKEKIPNAELQIIPNAAHISNLENPEEFNKHLINFLKKHD
jgi:3-oxoadipate enol-lactonase